MAKFKLLGRAEGNTATTKYSQNGSMTFDHQFWEGYFSPSDVKHPVSTEKTLMKKCSINTTKSCILIFVVGKSYACYFLPSLFFLQECSIFIFFYIYPNYAAKKEIKVHVYVYANMCLYVLVGVTSQIYAKYYI